MGNASIIAIILIAALCIALPTWSWDSSGGRVTVIVQNKFIDTGHDSSHYIITDSNGINYEIDKAWFNYFNGSPSVNPDSIYSHITIGKTYCLNTVGWRI